MPPDISFVFKRHPNENCVPLLPRPHLRASRDVTVEHLRRFLGAKLSASLDQLWPGRAGAVHL